MNFEVGTNEPVLTVKWVFRFCKTGLANNVLTVKAWAVAVRFQEFSQMALGDAFRISFARFLVLPKSAEF